MRILISVVFVLIIALIIVNAIDPVGNIQKAKDNQRKADLLKISKALDKFYKGNGRYPKHSTNPSYRIVRLDQTVADWGENFMPYVEILPKDPFLRNYVYFATSDGQKYYIYASLERGGKDLKSCNKGMACESLRDNGIDPKDCKGICNYEVTSGNVSP